MVTCCLNADEVRLGQVYKTYCTGGLSSEVLRGNKASRSGYDEQGGLHIELMITLLAMG